MLEYGTEVWSPHKQEEILAVERVQRSFLKRVFKRCKLPEMSYIERCKYCNLQTLEFRRKLKDLSMLFQIYFGYISIIDCREYFVKVEQGRRANQFQIKLLSKTPKNDSANYSFFERTCRIWNNLPNEVFAPPIVKLEVFLKNLENMKRNLNFDLSVI